jgi:hypothetical protein
VADHRAAGPLGAHQSREGACDLEDELLVDLLADQTSHVISLDDAVNSRSGPRHSSPRKGVTDASLSARESPRRRSDRLGGEHCDD